MNETNKSTNARESRSRGGEERKVNTTQLSGTARHVWLDDPAQQRLKKTTTQITKALGSTVSASVLIRAALKIFEAHVDKLVAANSKSRGNDVSFDLITLHRDLLEAARGEL